MRVEIKDRDPGIRCWNREAVQTYADEVTAREERLAAANPDLVVLSGVVKCYGCEVQDYDYADKCTARLTRTRYTVPGEIAPREADAQVSLQEIPGLATVRPDGDRTAAAPGAAAQPTVSTQGPGAPRPVGSAPGDAGQGKRPSLRGLFGRG
ncbi:MAG: hypothetical protein JWP61_2917 [Friedmanniella sp.]|nr:hypothetical protein [Friedmanniella sp.]